MNNQPNRRGHSNNKRKKKKLKPIGINLGKNDLMNRLYDRGFTHYTMPSVNRPETNNSHQKPLSCKMYSLSNNLTKQKKQKQSSILFNVQE